MNPPFFTTIRMLNGRTIDTMTFVVKPPFLVSVEAFNCWTVYAVLYSVVKPLFIRKHIGHRSVTPICYAIAKVYHIIAMICNVIKKPCPIEILDVSLLH